MRVSTPQDLVRIAEAFAKDTQADNYIIYDAFKDFAFLVSLGISLARSGREDLLEEAIRVLGEKWRVEWR